MNRDCCLIQRCNQNYTLQPWQHSRGCKNYLPTMIQVTSAMTGETRRVLVVR